MPNSYHRTNLPPSVKDDTPLLCFPTQLTLSCLVQHQPSMRTLIFFLDTYVLTATCHTGHGTHDIVLVEPVNTTKLGPMQLPLMKHEPRFYFDSCLYTSFVFVCLFCLTVWTVEQSHFSPFSVLSTFTPCGVKIAHTYRPNSLANASRYIRPGVSDWMRRASLTASQFRSSRSAKIIAP